MRTIALEEHFVTEALAHYGASTAGIAQPHVWAEASRRLLDLTDERIETMDAAGLDIAVLSLNSPGIQAEKEPETAVAVARTVNDFLAGVIAEHPDRFKGFAALPLQDPAAAAAELERTVTEYGFKGALVNAHTHGTYLDSPSLRPVWAKLEELQVPMYLHPGNGLAAAHVLDGHPELTGPMWSWGTDTATHALRLIFGGVFDDFPGARLLLGHMGEGLPYVLWRLDSRWGFHDHKGIDLKLGMPSEYLRKHVYVTTSGVCSDPPLRCALDALGSDHVLFGSDYPFEDMEVATAFLRTASVNDQERARISHLNAEALLGIDPAQP